MREVPQTLTDTWLAGEYTGDRRPMARVTLQKLSMSFTKLDTSRLFASAIFNQADIPREMPNVKSVEWDRSTGTDVATCNIVFYNTAPLPLGEQPVTGGDFDLPGYYTYNYGTTAWARQRWGQRYSPPVVADGPGSSGQLQERGWQDYLVPDRLLRTYEGYGFDKSVGPEKDPHLVQTGLWLIDDVEYSTDGLITVSCRDVGRMLLDHLYFPPVIPLGSYPLEWEPYHDVDGPTVPVTMGASYRPTYLDDSGRVWYGKNATIHGHKPSQAFDDSDKTYWLSVGNSQPNAGYSFEWIEGSCGGSMLSAVTYKAHGGPYRVYLSVKIKGKWSGKKKIPYDPDNPISHPNGGEITYSMVHTVDREGTGTFTLNHPVVNVDAIRLTFTSLWNSGIGPYKFRAGCRSVRCYTTVSGTKPGPKISKGNYGDYTEIIKYLLACGGFYWPHGAKLSYITNSDGTRTLVQFQEDDPFLKRGRVWGDLEMSRTTANVQLSAGTANKITADEWDKKPLMDAINYIRDILGFIFHIDETGGAVWRLPNLHTIGNFVGNVSGYAGYKPGNDYILTIDERQTLLGLRAKISSRNIREYDLVGNSAGTLGAASKSYNPIKPDPGFRRLAIWTDINWEEQDEMQRMADMMSIRRLMTYRQNTLQIIANPAIQIDDQIRLYERISGEGYYHYVSGVKSSNDLESGRWTYDLTTFWLGEDPFAANWAVDKSALAAVTREFLEALLAYRTYTRGFTLITGGSIRFEGRKK